MKRRLSGFYKKLRFILSERNSFLFTGFYKYFYSPKKGSLAYLLSEYSTNQKGDFTVIQIGANDGITHDPIHKFIKRDNWKGVLLEPQKHVYDEFLSKIYRKNKGIVTLNAALGEKDGYLNLYKIGFSNARWATGLATFDKEVLVKAFDSGHVAKNAAKEKIAIPANLEEQIVTEKVPLISAEKLLSTYHIDKIDLLQIDTEGFDYQIIKMFNVEKTKPRMIVFESSHLSKDELEECIAHLRNNNYQTITSGPNTIAMLKPLNGYDYFFDA
ncbi:MAG: FkbM family methyltransferase [Saprospiraceae bacterium]|nr:FkbM family methyltransferase [Saprospiraceae bacterium]